MGLPSCVLLNPRTAIRAPADRDIPGLVALVNALAAEGSGLFILPINGPDGAETLRAHLAAITRSGTEEVLVAEYGCELAGLLTATRGLHPARRCVATIGVGVRAEDRRCGIGRALMEAIEEWAEDADISRLELTVAVTNRAAIALYKSCGYESEGVLRASARVDGAALDQIMMAKLL